MNYIDILLIVVILFGIWNGWQRSFVAGTIELLSWVGGLVISFMLYPYVAQFFQKHNIFQHLALPLSLLLTLVIIRIVINLVISRLFFLIPHKIHSNVINKNLGLIPGVIAGSVYAALIAVLLLLVPISDKISSEAQNSKLASNLANRVGWLERQFSNILNSENNAPGFNVIPKAEKFIKLPFQIHNPQVRPDLEKDMLSMVNAERKKAGLRPLKADAELTQVARAHSKDMFNRGYFSHQSPEGYDPFYRIKKAKINFIAAGENLALSPTLPVAHQGLMNSPGHRANILNASFSRVGIGILDGGRYGIIVTQNFRN